MDQLGAAAAIHNHAAGNITSGTLGVARGGTGKASFTANRLIYPSASTTLAQLAFPTVAGSVLCQGTSGAPYWRSPEDLMSAAGRAKIELKSYTGAGVSGEDNACSVTFSFAPKVFIMLCCHSSDTALVDANESYFRYELASRLTTSYTRYRGFLASTSGTSSAYAKKSSDGRTIYWYHANNPSYQYNAIDTTYYVLAIG